MKRLLSTLVLILVGTTCMMQAQTLADELTPAERKAMMRTSCTSIMVGKHASTDGSVMTSHTCDSWYRTWMQIVPERDYPRDTVTTIWEGRMHTLNATDRSGMKEKGQIPQAKHTYRYLDTAYPCLNEKRMGIGETTIGGRDTLRNDKGMFYIEELSRIALERCSTAREAIRLMGDLIKQYGYGDSGECLTIADKDEVWIFEVFGEGPKKIGGVWAAVRIPDDAIAVSANICRIGRLDLSDTANYMASDNVFDVAKRLKLWDGKSEFSFWRAYSGGNYFDEVKNYSTREHFIMNALAPSLHLSDTVEELPLSVKPDHKVSVTEVMNLLGTYYEGTDKSLSCRIDSLSQGRQGTMVANPWMRPDEINTYGALLADTTMQNIRTVSVPWSAYSTVIQLRADLPEAVGGVAWVLLDNPGQSPRFPIFCGNTTLPDLLRNCGNHSYRDDTALWHYRRTNRLASVRWGKTRTSLEPARDYFRDRAAREWTGVADTYNARLQESPAVATAYLDGYTADFFGATIVKWDELYRKYWHMLWAGF